MSHTCSHYWLVDSERRGVCRYCFAEKKFEAGEEFIGGPWTEEGALAAAAHMIVASSNSTIRSIAILWRIPEQMLYYVTKRDKLRPLYGAGLHRHYTPRSA